MPLYLPPRSAQHAAIRQQVGGINLSTVGAGSNIANAANRFVFPNTAPVLSNVGGFYIPASGLFRCTVSGDYQFTVLTNFNLGGGSEVVRYGLIALRGGSYIELVGFNASGSGSQLTFNSVVTSCLVGDDIYFAASCQLGGAQSQGTAVNGTAMSLSLIN